MPNFGALQGAIQEIAETVAEATGDPIAAIRGRATETFRNTEGGNGDRMAARFGDKLLCELNQRGRTYYVARADQMWAEDRDGAVTRLADEVVQEMYRRADELEAGGDETAEIGQALRAWARQSDSMTALRAMAALAVDKYHRRVTASEHFDADPRLLSAGEEVVELRPDGVAVRKRERADRCTLRTSVPYRPDVLESPPPLIKQFIDTFLPEENRWQRLFKLLGSALHGGNDRRLFVILKGGTTSGKTQLVRGIIETLGGYVGASAATIFRTNHDDKPRPDVIALYKKRITFLAEASKSWRLEASRIKQFTGGDIDPQRGMRSDVIQQGNPMCMPVIYTNEMPKIVGLDEATKRRILVPTMEHTVNKDKEDPTIKERFIRDPEVHTWLLAALVNGYVESTKPGGLNDVLAEFALSTSAAISEMYHLGEFLAWLQDGDEPQLYELPEAERAAYGVKSRYVSHTDLFTRYTHWVRTFGDRFDRLEAAGFVDFNKQLRDNHGFIEAKSGVKRWTGWVLRDVSLANLQQMSLN